MTMAARGASDMCMFPPLLLLEGLIGDDPPEPVLANPQQP